MDSQIHLPTEILVNIVTFVAADDTRNIYRQRSLHACCLLSRQWYSAAISFLYEKPQISSGRSFKRFTDTVCPPVAARKSKYNLGGFVRRLDLSMLVHHSSNSLTARLLGRIKKNLEYFVAPSASFASNSLPALSKCHNLKHLDLFLVGDAIPFAQLKKTLQHLTKLTTLRLPRSTALTVQDTTSIDWPPNLKRLQLSGSFEPSAISSFAWPPNLTNLALRSCRDLSVNALGSLASSPQLSARLKCLTISNTNRNLQPESINAIPAFLPGLSFLSVPGDLVEETFFDILIYMTPPLALEILELGYPYEYNTRLSFSTISVVEALKGGLANLRALGFAEVFCTEQRILEDEEIDDILQKRADKEDPAKSNDELDDINYGVYYL
ncbi:F-box domain protein [Aspergillus sclerotialis]|uniref:F-box domain protein n=1 Tax=Aspergillus sclerotialis TaxID=2070753 RepID=A0A3A2ZDM3_9EURO|nr:F-box domain protein [Aspergillus sclerotialis]